jgi:hypothetical protein
MVDSKTENPATYVLMLKVLLFSGMVFWLLFYFMERFWYHRLLYGAVKQGSNLEKLLSARLSVKPNELLTEQIGKESPVLLPLINLKLHSKDKLDLYYIAIPILLAIIFKLLLNFSGSQTNWTNINLPLTILCLVIFLICFGLYLSNKNSELDKKTETEENKKILAHILAERDNHTKDKNYYYYKAENKFINHNNFKIGFYKFMRFFTWCSIILIGSIYIFTSIGKNGNQLIISLAVILTTINLFLYYLFRIIIFISYNININNCFKKL